MTREVVFRPSFLSRERLQELLYITSFGRKVAETPRLMVTSITVKGEYIINALGSKNNDFL